MFNGLIHVKDNIINLEVWIEKVYLVLVKKMWYLIWVPKKSSILRFLVQLVLINLFNNN